MAHTEYTYDPDNVFAKILRGEIPAQTVLESDHSLVFADISPQAPHHLLVIPKGAYVNYDHFVAAASADEIVDFNRTVVEAINHLGVAPAERGAGYRLITNAGEHGAQEVPHFHFHIIAGAQLAGGLVTLSD